MKQLLVEIDAETAARLDRVVPAKSRRRSAFVRAAIRRALWDLDERATAQAYEQIPDRADDAYLDASVWEHKPARKRRK